MRVNLLEGLPELPRHRLRPSVPTRSISQIRFSDAVYESLCGFQLSGAGPERVGEQLRVVAGVARLGLSEAAEAERNAAREAEAERLLALRVTRTLNTLSVSGCVAGHRRRLSIANIVKSSI